MEPDQYYTVEKPSAAEYKDRGSKFIAYVYPVESINDCKEKLALIKKQHPKATHHCFAYRVGFDGNIFRVSDDGEPAGTAGKPILAQIDSKKATNILIIVVRYFGGTLLGVPGLVHAYKTAASIALDENNLIQKPVMVKYRVQFDYTRMSKVMKVIHRLEGMILKQENQLFCDIEIAIPKKKINEFLSTMEIVQGVTINSL